MRATEPNHAGAVHFVHQSRSEHIIPAWRFGETGVKQSDAASAWQPALCDGFGRGEERILRATEWGMGWWLNGRTHLREPHAISMPSPWEWKVGFVEKSVHCRASLVHQVKLIVLSDGNIHAECSDLRSAKDIHSAERICHNSPKPDFYLADRLDLLCFGSV